MTRKQVWTGGFLGVTGLAVALELWAVWDGNPNTAPWTELITDNVPSEVTFAAIGVLTGWLAYRKRAALRSREK